MTWSYHCGQWSFSHMSQVSIVDTVTFVSMTTEISVIVLLNVNDGDTLSASLRVR